MSYDDPIDFQIAELIGKYLRGEISNEELAILERWQLQHPGNRVLWKKLNDHYYVREQLKAWPTDKQSEVLWDKMHGQSTGHSRVGRRVWQISAVAAIFLVAILYAVNRRDAADASHAIISTKPVITEAQPSMTDGRKKDVTSAGVILITEDGEQFALEDEQYSSGQLDKLELKWKGKGLLDILEDAKRSPVSVYHTIKTAVARTYRFELADGTNVWLNAISSLRYPVIFGGEERKVYLTGEAYFDVAEDSGKPFTVVTDKSYVRVLGTKFNVRSYPGEVQDRTSLFSGSVRVQGKSNGTVSPLKPGYEALVDTKQDIVVQRTSAYKVLAWKRNQFIFENEPLADLMEELSKWYGLNVHFEDTVAKTHRFTGRLKRYQDVNVLLNLISETSKVDFRVHDKHVWVRSGEKLSN